MPLYAVQAFTDGWLNPAHHLHDAGMNRLPERHRDPTIFNRTQDEHRAEQHDSLSLLLQ
jgi:hypothetical protein